MPFRSFCGVLAGAALIIGCGDGSGTTEHTSPRYETLDDFVANYWIRPIPPQGRAPAGWSEIETSLQPEDCGTCHVTKIEDWSTTVHAGAYSPGLSGQLVNWELSSPTTVRDCLACHAPLAEQIAWTAGGDGSLKPNPSFDPGLRDRGIACAVCHVRGHARYGPLPRDGSPIVSAEGAPHGGARRTAYFSDSRFCAGCHQFEAPAPEGKSIQNTYEEWKASRWAEEEVSCQDCHMPDRRHLWRGIHDPEMTRSAITIGWTGNMTDAVGLLVRNTGAGHHFPTYVTPEIEVRIALLSADGTEIRNGSRSWLIARKVENRGGTWVELSDSRIAAGEQVLFVLDMNAGGVHQPDDRATHARATITVRPDAVYRDVFAGFLVNALSDTSRTLLTEALTRASASPFEIFDETVPIQPRDEGSRGAHVRVRKALSVTR